MKVSDSIRHEIRDYKKENPDKSSRNIATLFGVHHKTVNRILQEPEIKKRNIRILFLDIETFPNISYTWGKYQQDVIEFLQESCIACYAAKWLGENAFAKSLPDYSGYEPRSYDDSKLVQDLWDLMDEADVIVAHNGCVAPGTKILKKDFTYANIEDLKVGDELLAFESRPSVKSHKRRFRPCVVTYKNLVSRPRIKIGLSDGTFLYVTRNHPFLVPNAKGNQSNWHWIFADELRVGDILTRILPVWNTDTSYAAGYLAAAVDGEGHVRKTKGARLGFAQKPNEMLEEFNKLIDQYGFSFKEYSEPHKGVHRLHLDGIMNVFRFLGTFQPKRLIQNMLKRDLAIHVPVNGRTSVISLEHEDTGDIVELSTSTGTYISEGFPSHNSSFDVKIIQGRFIIHNLPPPSPFKVVDTKTAVKKVARFNSNKLNDLAKLFGTEQKISTSFGLWKGCINGDTQSWKKMVEYNIQDVVLLENLYTRLLPYIDKHPNHGLFEEEIVCPKCGSHELHARGFARTTTRIYQRWQCQDCGGWSRSVKSEKDRGAQVTHVG